MENFFIILSEISKIKKKDFHKIMEKFFQNILGIIIFKKYLKNFLNHFSRNKDWIKIFPENSLIIFLEINFWNIS